MATFSIITICKNDAFGLSKTINSVRKQSFCQYEHILVIAGDCGTILPQPNQIVCFDLEGGISNAFNQGVSLAQYEFFIFLNAGDVFFDVDSLKSISNACVFKNEIITGFAQIKNRGNTIPRNIPNMSSFSGRRYLSHQASAFPRTLFKEIGGFDKQYEIRMDLDWLCRVPVSTNIIFLNSVLIDFDSGGVTEVRVLKATIEEIIILFKYLPGSLTRLLFVFFILFGFRLVRQFFRICFAYYDKK